MNIDDLIERHWSIALLVGTVIATAFYAGTVFIFGAFA